MKTLKVTCTLILIVIVSSFKMHDHSIDNLSNAHLLRCIVPTPSITYGPLGCDYEYLFSYNGHATFVVTGDANVGNVNHQCFPDPELTTITVYPNVLSGGSFTIEMTVGSNTCSRTYIYPCAA